MADTEPLDGYMFFVDEGKYNSGGKRKSVGHVKGESPDARFSKKNAFQIWYFKWECNARDLTGLRSAEDRDPRKNPGANRLDPKVSVGAFNIRKEIDLATPTLFLASATRALFTGCHVYFRKSSGGKMHTFFHAVFSDCIIEKWDVNLDGKTTEEKLTVNFDWCEVNYYPQTRDGGRKKGDATHTKQYCTSDPDSADLPKILQRNSGPEDGDMSLLFGGE